MLKVEPRLEHRLAAPYGVCFAERHLRDMVVTYGLDVGRGLIDRYEVELRRSHGSSCL